MKLLEKKQIDAIKARESQRSVEEGLKIARKVDSLRETRAEEEASLEKYRRETLAEIHKQITYNVTTRDALYNEVVRLEKRREDALKPITEEMDILEKKRKDVDMAIKEQKALEEVNTHTVTLLDARERCIIEKERLVEVAKIVANDNLTDVQNKKREADIALENARKVLQKAQSDADIRREELDSRETAILQREERAAEKEAELRELEQSIGNELRLLQDRRAMMKKYK